MDITWPPAVCARGIWPPRAVLSQRLPDYPLEAVGQSSDLVFWEDGTQLFWEDGTPLRW